MQIVPVHGNPENKVFELEGSIVGTNLGKLFVKQDRDTLNVGWREFTGVSAAAASPTTTTTAEVTTTTAAATTTTAAATTTTAAATTTTAAATTTTAAATTTTAAATTTTAEATTTTEDPNTTTTVDPGSYTEVSINLSPDPEGAPTRFDVSAVAYAEGIVFISHELFLRASYSDTEILTLPYNSIAIHTTPSNTGNNSDNISVSNAQNTTVLVVPYYVQAKSVLTTNAGTFVAETGVELKNYGLYPGLLSAPAIKGSESFP